jgi:hypothetical protein
MYDYPNKAFRGRPTVSDLHVAPAQAVMGDDSGNRV